MFLIEIIIIFAQIDPKKGVPELLDSGRKGWKLDCGPWTVDAGLWMLDSGRWTLDARLWTLDAGLWTLDSGLWTLNTVVDCCRTELERSF